MRRWTVILIARTIDGAGAGAATDTSKLREHVRLAALLKHMRALEAIADANGGTRASGTPGYAASVDYVVPWLVDKGYDVTLQRFDFSYFQEIAPAQLGIKSAA